MKYVPDYVPGQIVVMPHTNEGFDKSPKFQQLRDQGIRDCNRYIEVSIEKIIFENGGRFVEYHPDYGEVYEVPEGSEEQVIQKLLRFPFTDFAYRRDAKMERINEFVQEKFRSTYAELSDVIGSEASPAELERTIQEMRTNLDILRELYFSDPASARNPSSP